MDRIRDNGKGKPPSINLPIFEAFLSSLPPSASGVIRFRAKANIGLQHVQNGDAGEGARWLLDAFLEAPKDPRAIANKALALWLQGNHAEAYRYGREQMAADPTNQPLAGYLPQFAAPLPDVADSLDGIPEGLRETEAVILSHVQFLRVRDIRPDWWNAVREGYARFPASVTLKVLAAVADVDEIARDERFQRIQILTASQKATLLAALAVLDPEWRSKIWLLNNPYDDVLNVFAAAMIAHYFLHDTQGTLELIKHLADSRMSVPGVLVDAANMAHSLGDVPLAKRIIECAPDDPTLMFSAATIAIEEGDWDRAVTLFGKAEVPDTEKKVTETILKLAPLVQAKQRGAPKSNPGPELQKIYQEVGKSPRSLVLVATVATNLGAQKLARRAFKAAVDAVNDESHIATRLMVAAYAERVRSSAGVIRLLDGHLPAEGFENEYERLAVAHANERPHRKRNLTFFQTLPTEIQQRREIARAHACVLLDIGRLPDAVQMLRRLHNDDPRDAFITLRLVEALQRSGDRMGVTSLIRNLDLTASVGKPTHIMRLASLLAREGRAESAYPLAYELVRKNRNDPAVALGYVNLGIVADGLVSTSDLETVQVGSCVSLKGPEDARQTFVIDDGEEFFSIQVVPPNQHMARLLVGKAKGETVVVPRAAMGQPEVWTIEEITTKFIHLHRQILDLFETRFPGQRGISKFTVVDDENIEAVFDIVRQRSEQNRYIAATYSEKDLPLAFVARLVGGDVTSFAAYVRSLGGDIVTCRGNAQERQEAIACVEDRRGSGAVLDPYTARVAAELEILPELKKWFGRLITPVSTIDDIEGLIASERNELGKPQLSVSWQNGQFFRHEVTDEDRHEQISRLEGVRDKITGSVDINEVLIPDDVSSGVSQTLRLAGSRFYDAGFLAIEHGAALLSDDFRYREFCAASLGTEGIWLQAVLLASLDHGVIEPEAYARATLGLVARRHTHIALTGPVLYSIIRSDDASLSNFRLALTRLGGPTAEITSHLVVLRELLKLLWLEAKDISPLMVQAATSAALEAIVSGRKDDARDILRSAIWQLPRTHASNRFMRRWLTGHFVSLDVPSTPEKLDQAGSDRSNRPLPSTKRSRRRQRKRAGK